MRFCRCNELYEFSGADVLLLALAVHREQIDLIPHDHVVYDAIALGRSHSHRGISHPRFVYDITWTLTAFQPLGELLSLVNSVAIFVFEGFESIAKFRQCFNESGHCLQFSGGVP